MRRCRDGPTRWAAQPAALKVLVLGTELLVLGPELLVLGMEVPQLGRRCCNLWGITHTLKDNWKMVHENLASPVQVNFMGVERRVVAPGGRWLRLRLHQAVPTVASSRHA